MRDLRASLTAINDFISKPGLRWWDKVEFYNAKCEELILDGELLIEAIERAIKAEAEVAKYKRALEVAVRFNRPSEDRVQSLINSLLQQAEKEG